MTTTSSQNARSFILSPAEERRSRRFSICVLLPDPSSPEKLISSGRLILTGPRVPSKILDTSSPALDHFPNWHGCTLHRYDLCCFTAPLPAERWTCRA